MTTLVYAATPTRFPDRRTAGRRLAERLDGFGDADPVVLGLAPDGMPLAAEIARALSAPLDTVAVARLRTENDADRFGTAAEGGIALFDPGHRERIEAHPETVDCALLATQRRLEQRSAAWHHRRRPRSLHGRTVLLVADVLGDEQIAAAAACAARDRGAAHVVYVAPQVRLASALAVVDWVDEIVCLETVAQELTASDCYADSRPVSDTTVRALLLENEHERHQWPRSDAR
ncbi:MAG TPA: hypothetical protein VFN36_05315 [Solirubrobacteraceae bacterium]|nr:hypothetical protein [Solirubrobacteraceae bacterium]